MVEVFETFPNPKGLIAMSASKYICVLAAPDVKMGQIRVLHCDKGDRIQMISAHQSAIAAMALNNEGNIIATASDKVEFKFFTKILGHTDQNL